MTAQYYDLGNGRGYVRDNIDFYLKMFQTNQSVLEVGCGTGRVKSSMMKVSK
jgi:hypothetical protein